MKTSKQSITLRIRGGLGNQLFQVLALEKLAEETLDAKKIHNNSHKRFSFPTQLNSKGKLYKLSISGNSTI